MAVWYSKHEFCFVVTKEEKKSVSSGFNTGKMVTRGKEESGEGSQERVW